MKLAKAIWATGWWMAAFAVGYHMGYGDGLRWGKLQGTMSALGDLMRNPYIRWETPGPTGGRRGWTWKGRR